MPFRLGVASVALLVVMASGCSHRSSRSAALPHPSTASTSSTSGGTAPSITAGATPTFAAGSTMAPSSTASSTRCAGTGLSVTVTDLGAAAGTAYRQVVFRNISSRNCTMQGYPGVSFVDGRGRQIGASAQRVTGPVGLLTLAPSASAAALIAYHDAYVATNQTCQPTPAAGVRVYPPNETTSLIVPTSLTVCANPLASGTAGVSPVTTPANAHP